MNLPAKIFNAIEYKSQEEGGGGGGGAKEGRSGDGERKERMVSLASITSSVFKIAKI